MKVRERERKEEIDLRIRMVLVGGDQPLDENAPLKSLRQICGRPLNVYIRYKERADIDVDYVRVYPGILQ